MVTCLALLSYDYFANWNPFGELSSVIISLSRSWKFSGASAFTNISLLMTFCRLISLLVFKSSFLIQQGASGGICMEHIFLDVLQCDGKRGNIFTVLCFSSTTTESIKSRRVRERGPISPFLMLNLSFRWKGNRV